MKTPAWLQSAVIYQIWPPSFADSDGDGWGDLRGITSKLDHIASLGCNVIWLNPCFVSPRRDGGYDVSDFRRIDPRFGTNDDLRDLCDAAGVRGIRVLLDLVAGHTSVDHPWFQQSARHERNPWSDFYHWVPGAPPGIAAGSDLVRGWGERDAAFIANYFYHQPALNYGFADPMHPWQMGTDAPGLRAVRAELVETMKQWLGLGVSGFRIDMARSVIRANAPDALLPALRDFWSGVRDEVAAAIGEFAMISEWMNPCEAISCGMDADFASWVSPECCWDRVIGRCPDPADAYFHANGRGGADVFLEALRKDWEEVRDSGLIVHFSGNHDNFRMARGKTSADREMVMACTITLPGIPVIYYGDEIGMPFVEELASVEGVYSIRTGSRTPMLWNPREGHGFSDAPEGLWYLPPAESCETVECLERDAGSLLSITKRLLTLRRSHPALAPGSDWEVLAPGHPSGPLIYLRGDARHTVLAGFSPSTESRTPIPAGISWDTENMLGRGWRMDAGEVVLEAGGWLVAPGIRGG